VGAGGYSSAAVQSSVRSAAGRHARSPACVAEWAGEVAGGGGVQQCSSGVMRRWQVCRCKPPEGHVG
jgi:hypothetical protein